MLRKLFIASIVLVGFLMLLAGPAAAYAPEYHTNQEIYEKIIAWQDSLPDLVLVDTIGYSTEDELPIWAVKISHNVTVDEDEPTVLFVGNIHAEELIGTEIVMAMMDTLLTNRFIITPYLQWLLSLELWFIPTINPEGHQVVMDSLDLSYRKNKRDCNNNGIFDYSPIGLGNDIDGVDLNRNFPLNWVHGDTFMSQAHTNEYYDYFRGFWPLSESECQALWALGEREKFSFSIVWHASRTGSFSEKLYHSWDWEESGKTPPDYDVIRDLGVNMASRILNSTGTASYPAYATGTAAGNQHDSFYAYLGTIGYLIEAGPRIQSPWNTVLDIIDENLDGAFYLLDRAAGSGDIVYPKSQLTGQVRDAQTLEYLPAEVKLLNQHNAYLKPRTCDSTYGRYRRYLMPGTYDVEVRLRGYYPQTMQVQVNPTNARTQNFDLEPKPTWNFSGLVKAIGGGPLACTMFIQGEDVDDTLNITADGEFSHQLPEGEYRLIFDSPSYVVHYDYLNLVEHMYVEFELSSAEELFFDDFEGGLGQWITDGTEPILVRWGTEASDSLWSGGMVATESPEEEYLPNVDNWIELLDPLDLSSFVTSSLRFEHWYYFEPGYDSCWVEASDDGGAEWDRIAGPFWGQDIGWGTGYANLDPYCGSNDVRIRFRIKTDLILEEQGWRVDDVYITAADTVDSITPGPDIPQRYALYDTYPNPFNSQLTIQIDLSHQQDTRIAVWDIAGRKIQTIHDGILVAGLHRYSWQPTSVHPSGIYLIKIEGDLKQEIRKVLLLK